MSETPQEFYSGCTEPDFPPWWEKFGKQLAADSRMSVEMIAMAAWSVARELAERGAAGGLPQPDREFYEIASAALEKLREIGSGPCVCVGTQQKRCGRCQANDYLHTVEAVCGLPPSGPPEELGLLLNRLVLASHAKGAQSQHDIPKEDRITDADIEAIEEQIKQLAASSGSAWQPREPTSEAESPFADPQAKGMGRRLRRAAERMREDRAKRVKPPGPLPGER